MLASFWRTSHLLLALLTSVFLLIASITGGILSTKPVMDHVNSSSNRAAIDTVSLAQIIPLLKNEYIEVFSLEIDKQKAVEVDVIGFDEHADGKFIIDPGTGLKVADIPPKSEFYTWVTTLHRSLFMHATGRMLMGVTVFLLFLMAVSGLLLLVKQNNGIQNFFKRIKRKDRVNYYHTLLGRISFIPIIIMALSGTILFLNTLFEVKDNSKYTYETSKKKTIDVANFPLFQSTRLLDIKTIHFPFSEDPEDYYEIALHDRTVCVNQYTGEIVSEQFSTWVQKLSALSVTLHTGRGSWLWSIVLGVISVNLLYFMYSGYRIAWKRLSSITRNKVTADEAEFIILTGSENGTTRKFAQLLYNALLRTGKSVFISDMNSYQVYSKAKHLLIMTSTYGDGEAPFNARNFLAKVEMISQNNEMQVHIIGFGSMAYPKFCQYAIDVHKAIERKIEFNISLPLKLIDGSSYISFKQSLYEWKSLHSIKLDLPQADKKQQKTPFSFKVLGKKVIDDGYSLTFTLTLEPLEKLNFQSGDLLEIVPPGEVNARYYSVCKTNEGNIFLSIKMHQFGSCSKYLYALEVNTVFPAFFKVNSDFHFPKKDDVLMIANGTGIAPFLGMMSIESKQKKMAFFGGRNDLSFELYENIEELRGSKNTVHYALSKTGENKQYVQDLIIEHKKDVIDLLNRNGSIMICGSIEMRNGVLETLKLLLKKEGEKTLEKYIERNKILMDCY